MMRRRIKWGWCCLAAGLSGILLFIQLQATAENVWADEPDIIIIGNKNLPFDHLTKYELRDIFLQKKTYHDDVFLHITILSGGETHKKFLWEYFKKTAAQYRRYWKKMVFSGKGSPPMSFKTEKDLMAHVALTGGALGYVSKGTELVKVKRITITDE